MLIFQAVSITSEAVHASDAECMHSLFQVEGVANEVGHAVVSTQIQLVLGDRVLLPLQQQRRLWAHKVKFNLNAVSSHQKNTQPKNNNTQPTSSEKVQILPPPPPKQKNNNNSNTQPTSFEKQPPPPLQPISPQTPVAGS